MERKSKQKYLKYLILVIAVLSIGITTVLLLRYEGNSEISYPNMNTSPDVFDERGKEQVIPDRVSKDFEPNQEIDVVDVRRIREPSGVDEDSSVDVDDIISTRRFSGPNQFPPKAFKAYGIIAFPQRMTSHSRNRHVMICEAYLAQIPHVYEMAKHALAIQVVTVWPVRNQSIARNLNQMERGPALCKEAVKFYDLVESKSALKQAQATLKLGGTRGDVSSLKKIGRGPYLLAWSPGKHKGQQDALVLVADMSHVESPKSARNVMAKWVQSIEMNPELWEKRSWFERLRIWLKEFFDGIGRS